MLPTQELGGNQKKVSEDRLDWVNTGESKQEVLSETGRGCGIRRKGEKKRKAFLQAPALTTLDSTGGKGKTGRGAFEGKLIRGISLISVERKIPGGGTESLLPGT